MRASTEEDFWLNVAVGEPHECWGWLLHTNTKGYGRTKFQGTMILAHRLAFFFTNGYFPGEGRVVAHTCDNPACCNPSHLKDYSFKANTLDSISKGRYVNHNAIKTICKRGHSLLDPKNVRIDVDGARRCRACDRLLAKLRRS